jgi:hypothetical protein
VATDIIAMLGPACVRQQQQQQPTYHSRQPPRPALTNKASEAPKPPQAAPQQKSTYYSRQPPRPLVK